MSFPNIFVNYPLGEMWTTNTKWKHWDTTPLRLWQTQLTLVFFSHWVLVGLVLSTWIMRSIPWLGCYINFTCITTWGVFWKDYRSHCSTSLDSMLLIILTAAWGFSSCARTMEFLMTPWSTETRSEVLWDPSPWGVGPMTPITRGCTEYQGASGLMCS